ncbi:MAG TPA: hypothetical protein VLJ68_00280 [Chitinophagaceae bacterium]|nr:hypothetical protein [Chitinophagaceae bacterium]
MKVIDRLLKYLSGKGISAYAFERNCQVANGYLKKHQQGKGSIGSDILQKVHRNYPDLDLVWLLAGEGEMLVAGQGIQNLLEEERQYYSKDEKIQFLAERISLLESQLADKKKIIELMEAKRNKK